MTLNELLQIEPKAPQAALKKAFMPYSSPIDVEGCEREALTILLNLSRPKPLCDNLLDAKRARVYFAVKSNLQKAIGEIKWFHTHNLKFPDCRVKDQRLIGRSLRCALSGRSQHKAFGWAHNSAVYSHTIWLLNTFIWQGEVTCLLQLILEGSETFLRLLKQFGLTQHQIQSLLDSFEADLPDEAFPLEMSNYSKQLLFPFLSDYVSVTPVVSHAFQIALEHAFRENESGLKFTTLSLPNPASVGNLCASTGGKMKLLYYPIGVHTEPQTSLLSFRQQHDKYFDNFQITNPRFPQV